MASQQQGVVARLIRDKGFGFVRSDNGEELFFHRSSARNFDQLQEGARVEFQAGNGPKGPRAEHVNEV
jgi:CspA family cold shock protein